MIQLWVEQIGGQYWICWADHDDHDKKGGKVTGSDRPSIEKAIDLLNELHLVLVARGFSLMRSDGSTGPSLAVDANAAQLEAATGRKFGQRKG